MAAEVRATERILAEVEEQGEVRRVSLIEGESLMVMESSRGPVTQLAYGAARHGHKLMCGAEVCGRVFGVAQAQASDALARFFGQADDVPTLSDLMDLFDKAQERYGYAAWTSEGDALYRSTEA
jgi:hypothetical protein